MTFPVMPYARPPLFKKGTLVLTDTSPNINGTISIGEPSQDRVVILVALGASGGSIPVWSTAPQINSVSMTQIAQDGATLGDDGQRGAIFALKVPAGTSATMSSSLASYQFGYIFTMTGVKDFTSNTTRVGSGSIVNATQPACTLYYAVDNFGSQGAISNMTMYSGGVTNGTAHIGADYNTDTTTTAYTYTSSSLALQRFVSWPFNY